MKKRGGEYRGTLKARINKLYGGDVTCDKVKKLKSRKRATKRDVQLANWFINRHCCGRKKT
jgi:translation elongation factor EF-4